MSRLHETGLSAAARATGLVLLAAGIGLCQYVEDSVDVGGARVGSLCYNSRADVVYGECHNAQSFFAIDCATNTIVARLGVNQPYDIVYDALDNKAYVTFADDSVLVVDGATHQRVGAVRAPGATFAVWDSTGDRLYVSGSDLADTVTVIDCRADTVVTHIPTAPGPSLMHVSARHRKLYVQNYDDCSVSIVDLASNQVIRSMQLGAGPQSGCYVASVDKYYGGTYGGDVIAVIDGAADSLLRAVPLTPLTYARYLAHVAAHGLLVAAVWNGGGGGDPDTVWFIDTAADTVVFKLPVAREPEALLWSPRSDLLYCANRLSRSVSVLAGDGSRVMNTLRVSVCPFVIAVSAVSRRIYVGHLDARWVYVVRDAVGIAEEPGPLSQRFSPTALVSGSVRYTADCPGSLADASGRTVMTLRPGTNDASALAPGVYVAVDGGGRVSTKVVKVR